MSASDGRQVLLAVVQPPDTLGELSLAERAPTSDGEAVTVTMPALQAGMADMVGISRQSYNQALRRLANRGWIAPGDGKVTLLDLSALRHRGER